MANRYGVPSNIYDSDSEQDDTPYTPDPNWPATQQDVDDASLYLTSQDLAQPSGMANDPPAWGMVTGQIVEREHQFTADRKSYHLGKGQNTDVQLAVPKMFEGTVSRRHCTIKWNGWGVPGYGNEKTRDMGEDVKPEATGFTITNTGTNDIYVGTEDIIILHKDETGPLLNGTWVQFVKPEKLAALGVEQEKLRFHFFSPRLPRHMQAQDEFSMHFTLAERLNSGQFGTVFRAIRRSDGKAFAVKRIPKSTVAESESQDASPTAREEMAKIERETEIMRIVENHENIVSIHGTFESKEYYYIVMDLIEGGELFKTIVDSNIGLPEADIWYYMKQLISGMAFVHRKGVAHRDLKPENIMMTREDRPKLKIVDFGLAKVAKADSFLKSDCGTWMYRAPEVLKVVKANSKKRAEPLRYDVQVDAWSIGIIMFVMFAAGYPWTSDEVDHPSWKPSTKTIDWKSLYKEGKQPPSPLAMDFMKRLLVDNPKDRMSVIEAENHAWLTYLPSQPSFLLGNNVPTASEQEVENAEALQIVNAQLQEAEGSSTGYYTSMPSLPPPFIPGEYYCVVPDSQPIDSYGSYTSEDSQDVNMGDFDGYEDDMDVHQDEQGQGQQEDNQPTGMSQFINFSSHYSATASAQLPSAPNGAPFPSHSSSFSSFTNPLHSSSTAPTTAFTNPTNSFHSAIAGLPSIPSSFSAITPPADSPSNASSFAIDMPGAMPPCRTPTQTFAEAVYTGQLTPRPSKRTADTTFGVEEADEEAGARRAGVPPSPQDEEMTTPSPAKRTPVRSSERLKAKHATGNGTRGSRPKQSPLKNVAGPVSDADGSPHRARRARITTF